MFYCGTAWRWGVIEQHIFCYRPRLFVPTAVCSRLCLPPWRVLCRSLWRMSSDAPAVSLASNNVSYASTVAAGIWDSSQGRWPTASSRTELLQTAASCRGCHSFTQPQGSMVNALAGGGLESLRCSSSTAVRRKAFEPAIRNRLARAAAALPSSAALVRRRQIDRQGRRPSRPLGSGFRKALLARLASSNHRLTPIGNTLYGILVLILRRCAPPSS